MASTQRERELEDKLQELEAKYDILVENNNSLNERVLELYTLYNISKTLSMSLQVTELFDLTMKVIGRNLKLDQYCLMLLDQESNKLIIQASHGLPEQIVEQGEGCSIEGVCHKVVSSKKTVMINDIADEHDFFYYPDSGIERGSYLGVPLITKDGRVIGLLNAHKPQTGGFEDRDLRLFRGVAEHVAIAIDNAIKFQQTREMINRDELTNLYNRRYFFERFEKEVYRADRYQRPLSLLMLDIDHFKKYNDTFGHLRGDEALKKLSRIMERNLRKADVLARYGGEEFLIMLPETTKDGAASVGEKLRQQVEDQDFNEDAPDLGKAQMTVTIGVASVPDDAEKALEALDLADKALYYGKAKGRNMVCTEVPSQT